MKTTMTLAIAILIACNASATGTVKVSTADQLLDAIRRVENDKAAPRTILIAPGRYYLTRPIDLGPAHSNVVIRGAGAGKTILYGGQPVTGWRKEANSPFFFAPLPAESKEIFRTLVKDDALAPVAVYPGGTNRFSHLGNFDQKLLPALQGHWARKPTDSELRRMPYRVEDIPDSVDIANADIRLFHMWSDSLCAVSNVDKSAHVLWTCQRANWAMGACNRRQYEVLNVREGMTEPGRWYADRTKRTLHYWPLQGEDISKIRFVVPTLPYVIGVQSNGENMPSKLRWTSGIVLADFTVTASAPPASEMSSFGGSGITAAITVRMTDGLRIENIAVVGVGGMGILAADARHATISGCDIRFTGARGMGLGGWRGSSDNLIVSNRISDVGTVYRGSSGMGTYGTNFIVRRNEICRTPYCGICGGGTDNLYEENYIHHVMQVLHDGGAIYGNLTRCTLRRNVVHDVVPDGNGFGVHAYYADEGSRDCIVEDNYAEGVGTPIHNHMTLRTVVRGNTLVFRGPMTVSFQNSADCAFSNNTIVCTGALKLSDPDAVPHWANNIAIRPSDAKDILSRRIIGNWEPERPQQTKRWEGHSKAPRAKKAIAIDHNFGSDEWPSSWMAMDRTPDRHRSGFVGAMARFSWDDANLYVSFRAAGFKSSTVSKGSVWGRDDGVELTFGNGRRIRAYYSGATQIEPKAFANAGVKVIGGKDPSITKSWENQNVSTYEIAVPWKALGLEPKVGLKVPFNACAYMSELGQFKCWEGTVPFADGKPAGETPSNIVLDK